MGSTANILQCRLCHCEGLAENFEELFVLVSDGRVQAHPVAHKIERYLELEVKLDDPLPKRICKSCEIRIDQWSQYFDACHSLFEELQANIIHVQKIDPEILSDREQQHWPSERSKADSWNDGTQPDHWDSVMSELSTRKEIYQDVPHDHLDHSSSPNSDCYTGISGLLKAAEVTGLEEARLVEKNLEFQLAEKDVPRSVDHSQEGDYADFYPYDAHQDDLMNGDIKEQYSPTGPINLTGTNYNQDRMNQSEWRDEMPNHHNLSPHMDDNILSMEPKEEILLSTEKSNLTADQLVQLLGSKHPALKGQLAQALIGQHLSLGAASSSSPVIIHESLPPIHDSKPPALIRITTSKGANLDRGSHSEEGSADEWGSSVHSGSYFETDARHVPVLTSTGNPPEVSVIADIPARAKIPVSVEQIRTPRKLSQKDINELSALFERDDKQGIMAFINKATRHTVRMWRCTRCSATIEGLMRHLEDHYNMGHNVDPEYECDLCEEILHSSQSYVRHWASHIPIKRCDICNKAGGNFYHIPGSEDSPRRVVCEVCSRRYMVGTPTGSSFSSSAPTPRVVKKQITTPGEDGKFPCEICGKRLKSKQTLSTHMTLHKNDKSVPCPECSMAFTTKADLRTHRSTAHENDKRFICPVMECQKRFKTRVALKGHETLHTGEKPYKCPVCPKEIRAQSNFYTHLKVHRKRGEEVPVLLPNTSSKKSGYSQNLLASINELLHPSEKQSSDVMGSQPIEPSTESSSSEFQESPMASDLSLRSQGHIDTTSPWGYDIDQ